MWYFLFSIQTSLMQTYFTKILGWKTAFSYLFFVFQSLRVFPFLFSKIVLVAVQDSAASHVGVALDSLRRVGAIDPILVEYRGSYALIGTPDANKPPWVTQDQHPRYKGPSEISIRIPLSGKKKKAVPAQHLISNETFILLLQSICHGWVHGETQNHRFSRTIEFNHI